MNNNGRIFVGIPVLNRSDLLARCLSHIDVPATIVIVNNNRNDFQFEDDVDALAARYGAMVLKQERNLGVSASWNLIIRTAETLGFDECFIGSNDTALASGSLAAAVSFPKEPDVAIWHLMGFSFFMLNRRTIERVGWFDENFYPAYKEDQDYAYRCQLAGLRRIDVPGAGGDHVGSATINSNPLYQQRNIRTHFDWNMNHYRMKWGDDSEREKFIHPYNDPTKDHRWWPDPGGSIEARDWDNEDFDRRLSSPS